jgi:uncharacterized membrane protein
MDANILVDVALQSGAIIGLTAVIGKVVPEAWRDIGMPIVAMLIGIGVTVLPMYIDVTPILQGIVLGGSVTGLYGVAKDMKTTPNVVVNK